MSLNTRLLDIEGMTCGGCVSSVHDVVSRLDGVKNVSVNLEDNIATVTYDDADISIKTIADAITEAGFDATVAND